MSADSKGLSGWLREMAEKGGKGVVGNIDARGLGRAADALDAQARQIEALRGALDPFAKAADKADEMAAETERHGMGRLTDNASTGLGITFGHCRSARAALAEKEPTT